MKQWVPAEGFRSLLEERRISVTRFSEAMGFSPSTVHRWLKANRVPADAIAMLDKIEDPGRREFENLLVATDTSVELFLEMTGINHGSYFRWHRAGTFPKWAILILKQRLAIQRAKTRLREKEANDAASEIPPQSDH